jgi:hypothetical protein
MLRRVIAVVFFALLGGFAYFLYSVTHVELDGQVTASGGALGNWVMTPDICESGYRRAFFGVRLFSSKDKNLAIVYADAPTDGQSVSANIPQHKGAFRFKDADCRVLKGDLWRGPKIDTVRSVGGTLDIDCAAEGSHLAGHITFSNCH